MQPQGTGVVNTAWIDQLTADIGAINGCAALQALANEAMATLQAEVSAIQAEIASLLPLTQIPTSLGSVISWITSMAQPYITAVANYEAQLAQILAASTKLTAAIEHAATTFTNCQVAVPIVGSVKV